MTGACLDSMASKNCPYCGAILSSSSLRFCISCRHSISAAQLRAVADEDDYEDDDKSRSYSRSRKSYGTQRGIRIVSYTLTSLMTILLVYICTMKFVLNQSILGSHNRLRHFIHNIIKPGE